MPQATTKRNEKRVGWSNGVIIGLIANGISRDELRERVRAGEFPGANLQYVKAWLDERDNIGG